MTNKSLNMTLFLVPEFEFKPSAMSPLKYYELLAPGSAYYSLPFLFHCKL